MFLTSNHLCLNNLKCNKEPRGGGVEDKKQRGKNHGLMAIR